MARHQGNNGIVKIGATTLGDVVDWDLDETATEVDLSGLNDAWDVGESGSKSWSGNVTLRFNTSDVTQETLRAGAQITVSFYSEGDATGKAYFSGTANIGTVGVGGVSRNTAVDKKVSFKGTGALSTAVVV